MKTRLKHNSSTGKLFLVIILFFSATIITINSQSSHKSRNAILTNEPFHVDLFRGGEEGYSAYRIPSVLTTKSGTILAFAEGRASKSDHAENDIVLKRSLDKGKTWKNLQVIAEDGNHCLNNPTAVQVDENNRILLMYQRYFQGFDEHKAVPGYEGEKICRTYVIYSDDDGVTWSVPEEITRNVKREEVVTSTATGPGVGIQIVHGKYSGRIIMPFNQGPYGNWKVYMAYSDDLGKTWSYGQVAPESSEGLGNEVQVVELQDGSLMLNSRSAYGDKLRKSAISINGGETWSGLIDESELIEPQCMGSILRFSFKTSGERNRILFSNPASRDKRELGSVRISYDEGKTWPVSKVIHTGFFAYSCLTKIDNETIGLLYEKDNYEKITFAIIDLAWLEKNE